MLLILSILDTSAYACDEPLKLADANQYLEQSMTALQNMDVPQASLIVKSIGNTINCFDEPVTPEFASQYYLMQGILLWAANKQDASVRYFDAAKSVQPDIKISTDIFPQTHEIHVFFKVAPKSSDVIELVPTEGEQFYLDGLESTTRSAQRPTIFQAVDENGLVLRTQVVDKGQELPEDKKEAPEPVPVEEAVVLAPKEKRDNTMLWVAIGFGSVSAGTGTMASLTYLEAKDLDESDPTFESLRLTNQILVISASVTGAVTAWAGLKWLRSLSDKKPEPSAAE